MLCRMTPQLLSVILVLLPLLATAAPKHGRRSVSAQKVVMMHEDMYPSQTDYAGQQQLNTCGANTPNPSMTLHKFHGQNSPKCTDGSPARYLLVCLCVCVFVSCLNL